MLFDVPDDCPPWTFEQVAAQVVLNIHVPVSTVLDGLLTRRCDSAKHSCWTLHRHPDGSVTWHSPLHRTYDRPGPWDPPPQVDPLAEPPPRRQPPTAADPCARLARGPALLI